MPPFGDEITAKLKENGTFGEAHRYRSKLIATGTPAVEALRKTTNKFLRTEGRGNPTMKTLTAEDRRVPKSIFKDKKCSAAEAVLWVADNIQIRNVKPQDAPSSAAWAILVEARSGAIPRIEYWKLYGRIIPKTQSSEEERGFHHDPDAKLPDYLRDDDAGDASEDGDDGDES